MNKFFINILSFSLALLVSIGLFFILKEKILNFYAKPLQNSLERTVSLQSDLEQGKIVVFGSSELVLYPDQKFLPQNYFNKDLKLPLRAQGNEGQQTFVMMAQLAACDNEKVRENAKVVILLSPTWFTGDYDNGLSMPKFLEYMYSGMMNKLYFQSEADDKYKILVSNYIQKDISLINNPSFIYKNSFNTLQKKKLDNEAKKFIIQDFDNKDINPELIKYKDPELDYESLKIEAKKVEIPSENNIYGINDKYYTENVAPEVEKGAFPFGLMVLPDMNQNQEYQDFLALLDFFKTYKIKPLFVMEDLHPYTFVNNREDANKLVKLIKSKVLEHNYEYLDMWSYKKEDYVMGTLIDMVHNGELAWVKIDQKIIEYFIKNKENK